MSLIEESMSERVLDFNQPDYLSSDGVDHTENHRPCQTVSRDEAIHCNKMGRC